MPASIHLNKLRTRPSLPPQTQHHSAPRYYSQESTTYPSSVPPPFLHPPQTFPLAIPNYFPFPCNAHLLSKTVSRKKYPCNPTQQTSTKKLLPFPLHSLAAPCRLHLFSHNFFANELLQSCKKSSTFFFSTHQSSSSLLVSNMQIVKCVNLPPASLTNYL